MITHEIPHIFRVQKRWNRENRPILTTLNLRSKSPRFCGHPFTPDHPYGMTKEKQKMLKSQKSHNSNYLKLTIKECTVF